VTVFTPASEAEPVLRPWWYHPDPPPAPQFELPSMPDPAYAAGCQLVPLAESVVDVFGRCEWCRKPTPGVLADCEDPDCPGRSR